MPKEERILPALGGQSAPLTSGGQGRRVLFCCASCQRIWLQDGSRVVFDLSTQRLATLAQELSADLAQLPPATCRFCLFQHGRGAFEVDEYGRGQGYGLSWECPDPLTHALGAVTAHQWMARQTAPTAADIVTRPDRLRAVLRWLQAIRLPRQVQLFPPEYSAALAADNRPGFGASGTEDWQWKGFIVVLPCPPLGGPAIVTLGLALPPSEALASADLLELWQLLLEVALAGKLAGE